ncbi:MAG: 23S rRNA (adenine(2503)-C(2))-methyltransferase RlmN [Clostridia bacterium]
MIKLLSDLNLSELQAVALECGQPKFRAKQLYEWLLKGVNVAEMTNLPSAFLTALAEKGYIAQPLEIVQTLVSQKDGTRKYLFRMTDGNVVEGVLMKYVYGNTICVSTQVGCRMNCAFCASGLHGLVRNLQAGEILGQVIAVNRDIQAEVGERAIRNIVLMGSGEPLDNYEQVTRFLDLANDPDGLNISHRNISLSTCGLCDMIKQLADDGYAPTLTISLHAPNDTIRKEMMPIANKYTVQDVLSAVRYYFDKTGRRIIFEYAMVDGVNDTPACAKELSKLVANLQCHINLIRLNYVAERGLHGSQKDNVANFLALLTESGVSATIRRTMGSDIDGACGQLRQTFLSEKTSE